MSCTTPASKPRRRRHHLLAGLLACVAAGGLLGGCATPMPATIDNAPVDLSRYMGQWRVIANVPYFGERGHVTSYYEYTPDADDKFDVRYVYRTGFDQPVEVRSARATVEAGSNNRDWVVRFMKVIPSHYRILEVAPDYSWALVDYPGRNLAWILARKPVMDDTQYQDLEKRIRGHGVDTDRMRRVPQVPKQVGRLNFSDPQDMSDQTAVPAIQPSTPAPASKPPVSTPR